MLKPFIVGLVCTATLVQAEDLRLTITSTDGLPLDSAVVYLESDAAKAALTSLPKRTASIVQQNQTFIPGISVVSNGTEVDFPNFDSVRHHVYSFSKAKTFDIKLYLGRPPSKVTFDDAGVVVLGCNIHDDMLAWVLVVNTPYYAITDKNGIAHINAPQGDYSLRVWDRRLAFGTPAIEQPLRLEQTMDTVVRLDNLDFDPFPNVASTPYDASKSHSHNH